MKCGIFFWGGGDGGVMGGVGGVNLILIFLYTGLTSRHFQILRYSHRAYCHNQCIN